MIKLTIELKDEKFIYSYEVGEGNQSGESPICPESLHTFNLCVKMCHADYTYRYKIWEDEMRAKAYIEKHPELLKTINK